MKLKCGDMLIVDADNGALSLQLIGRDDVPRVEEEGYGWSDGATVLLKGADVAEFLDALGNAPGEYGIGDSGLFVKVEHDGLYASDLTSPVFVLSAKDVSVMLTWPERTLLVCAIRDLAWMMFK